MPPAPPPLVLRGIAPSLYERTSTWPDPAPLCEVIAPVSMLQLHGRDSSAVDDRNWTYLAVSFPNFGITTLPFKMSSSISRLGKDLSRCPGARLAGLGGPWGRRKIMSTRKKTTTTLMRKTRAVGRAAILLA